MIEVRQKSSNWYWQKLAYYGNLFKVFNLQEMALHKIILISFALIIKF